MLASQTRFGMFRNPRFLVLTSLLVLITLAGGCTNTPTPPPEIEENVLTTPDANFPTATPFQPGGGLNTSPYYAPVPNATLIPSIITPGTITVEESSFPTPFPSGYQGMPVYALSTNTNPLTGLTAADPELLQRRPMAIKITQYPRYVRPQSGLTLADVVYEYYIEAGLTRFIAIFYGNNSPEVGPVRSGRFFDEHITRMYQAFLVFKYADPRVYDYLGELDIKHYLVVPGNGACPPFLVGSPGRDTYNNIFFNTVKFKDCIAKRTTVDNDRPPLRSNFFSTTPPQSDRAASRIYTRYSLDDYNYWEYLPTQNRYLRYQEVNSLRNYQTPNYATLTDKVTDLPVQADNVVVLFVQHRFADKWQAEDEVYHIDLYGSGQAYVFRDGVAVDAIWNRPQLDQPILLTTSLGAPVYLKPGVTFYQVIGLNSETWREGDDWHFIFHTP